MSLPLEQLKENRKKWVAALRSGKYKQGKGNLHAKKTKEFCCLGVLCVVAGLKPTFAKGYNGVMIGIYEEHNSTAPLTARNFVGLRTEGGGYFDSNTKSLALWSANDFDSLTFDEIANIIESEPEGLFKND